MSFIYLEIERVRGSVNARWNCYHPKGHLLTDEARDQLLKPICAWFLRESRKVGARRGGFEVAGDGQWKWRWWGA